MPYVYDHTELYDFDLSYDGWPLYDTGLPDGITRTGQRLFDLLPDYVRDADGRDELLRYVASIGDAAHPVAAFIDGADPDTSATGTSEPVNPATAPAGWLGWLGWLIGIPTAGMTTSNARWYLTRAGAQAHGSREGIRAAVQATLTGTRFCNVVTGVAEGGPWYLLVQVRSDEVADSAATLAAAMREKPAGVNLTLSALTPVTYTALDAAYGTYADMAATAKTYDELRFS
jgi:hypothetical protein